MSARPRLSTLLKMVLALTSGLALGWGRQHFSAAPPQDSAAIATAAASPSSLPGAAAGRSQPAAAAPHPPAHDLAGVERLLNGLTLPPDALAALQHLSTSSLKDLLQARMQGGELDGMRPRLRLDLRSAAAVELYRRGADASFQWAAQLPPGEAEGIGNLLITEALIDQPTLARAWLDRLHPGQPTEQVNFMVFQPYEKAIARDAAFALEYESLFATELEPDFRNDRRLNDSASFPPDFDYHRFIAGTQIPASARAATIAWAICDPEAAFTGLSAEIPARPELLGRLAEGVSATRGEDAAALWLSEKLSQLPSDLRDQATEAAAKIPALRPPKTPPR
ncbi:MAG: hypothetical protein JWO82_1146 [Akkermansiaceae bacterium]|nr:hypothetical protein [Akkermansiaceae bacterium]